jgi:hypothetical protein
MAESKDGTTRVVWPCTAALLLYPATVAPALRALVLLISALCVLCDAWTFPGAMENVCDALPVLARLSALWTTTLGSLTWLASRGVRFVLTATGLLLVMIHTFLVLNAELPDLLSAGYSLSFATLWLQGGPPLVACVNLVLLIRTRESLHPSPSPPDSSFTTRADGAHPSHLRPVILKPYRHGVSEPPIQSPQEWH